MRRILQNRHSVHRQFAAAGHIARGLAVERAVAIVERTQERGIVNRRRLSDGYASAVPLAIWIPVGYGRKLAIPGQGSGGHPNTATRPAAIAMLILRIYRQQTVHTTSPRNVQTNCAATRTGITFRPKVFRLVNGTIAMGRSAVVVSSIRAASSPAAATALL